jgi:hypothetical protein
MLPAIAFVILLWSQVWESVGSQKAVPLARRTPNASNATLTYKGPRLIAYYLDYSIYRKCHHEIIWKHVLAMLSNMLGGVQVRLHIIHGGFRATS